MRHPRQTAGVEISLSQAILPYIRGKAHFVALYLLKRLRFLLGVRCASPYFNQVKRCDHVGAPRPALSVVRARSLLVLKTLRRTKNASPLASHLASYSSNAVTILGGRRELLRPAFQPCMLKHVGNIHRWKASFTFRKQCTMRYHRPRSFLFDGGPQLMALLICLLCCLCGWRTTSV